MNPVLAEVITIGDEILYGKITDTNTRFISAELDTIGIKTIRKSSVGDAEQEILGILKEAEQRADIILITGGLGPTKDDITKTALCKYFGAKLILNEEALRMVTELFERRGRTLSELNRMQAMLPDRCEMIPNHRGTAPGMWFERDGKVFISMPGVPEEMHHMMEESVLPKLKSRFKTPVIFHKEICTVGIPESILAEKINAWSEHLPPHMRLAYLPSYGQVKLRLSSQGLDLPALREEADRETAKLLSVIPKYIYGYEGDKLESVLGKLLTERKMTVATAESCTGGHTAHMLSSIPGSSAYFMGGVVAYHNSIKTGVLGVKPETLAEDGAVSEKTVIEMAEGVRKFFHTNYALSCSGIAGPTGGTAEKPVGTVWIACAGPEGTVAKKLMLGTDRETNIRFTSIALLNLLRLRILYPDDAWKE